MYKNFPFTILSVVFGVMTVLSLFMFALRIRREPIHSRSPFLVFPSAIYCVYSLLLISFSLELGALRTRVLSEDPSASEDSLLYSDSLKNKICLASTWNIIFLIPMWILPHFSRAVTLYFCHRRSLNNLQEHKDTHKKRMAKCASSSSTSSSVNLDKSLQQSHSQELGEMETELDRSKQSWFRSLFTSFSFRNYKRYTSLTFHLSVILIVLVLTFIVGISELTRQGPSTYCLGNSIYISIFQSTVTIFGLFFAAFKLYKVEDGYYFSQEFKVFAFTIPFALFVVYLTYFVSSIPYWLIPLFLFIAFFSTWVASVVYPLYLSYTREFVASSLSRLNLETVRSLHDDSFFTESITFEDIFRSKHALDEFTLFATKLWCVENLLFFLAVRKFEKLTEQNAIEKEAKNIYRTFLMSDSLKLVNLDTVIIKKIESKILNNSGDLINSHLFDESKAQIERLLKYDTYTKWTMTFKRSKELRKADSTSTVNTKLEAYHTELTTVSDAN